MEIWKNLDGRYNITKTHIKLLEMKTTMYEMKNTLDGIKGRKEKTDELEGIETVPTQNETQ